MGYFSECRTLARARRDTNINLDAIYFYQFVKRFTQVDKFTNEHARVCNMDLDHKGWLRFRTSF